MKEILYDQSTLTIALVLLMLMAFAIEAGYRIGSKTGGRSHNKEREQVNTIQSSLLGILALMLGFTFSLALERFNSRSDAVVEEANAIGTAYLRSALLPESIRSQTQESLRKYLRLRVQAGALTLNDSAEREPVLAETAQIQEAIWRSAIQASRENPNPVTTGLFIQALNEMIDAYGVRVAELDRHVPEMVLILLYGSFIVSGGIIGYTAGIAGHRPATASYIMVFLVVLLMIMVMDLDRPRRGFIKVNQQNLIDLYDSINVR